MTFTFHGTRHGLTERIESAAKAENRDIYIDDKYPGRMEIGFERHGHSGGRFFYADITDRDGVLTLTGEAEDSHRHPMSPGRRMLDSFLNWAGGFLFLAFCMLIFWAATDGFFPIWMVPLPPALFLLIRIPMSRKEQRQVDEDFFAFLARALR